VKSTFRLFIGPAALSLTLFLSGCGQPGPLYLPKPPAAKQSKGPAATVPTPAPVMAPPVSPIPTTPPAPQQ
jgi:predicted small lipoprotein YifL